MACCGVILYYIQWCFWSAYQCILRCPCSLCCCCETKYKLYLYDYETVNFTKLFKIWANRCFKFDLWTPQSLCNTQRLIMVVCEEKTRQFADMGGALENFTDEHLKQTVFVYITEDAETKIFVPDGHKFSTVPIVYISKERSWASANIFRKTCAYLVKLAKVKTPSEQTPLT